MIEEHLNLFDMIRFPKVRERKRILKNSKITQIRFEIIEDRNIFPIINPKYSSLVSFNNYINSCIIQYIELYGYYKDGLPEYIPKKVTEKLIRKVLFNQTAEIFFMKINVCFELICQGINEIFELGINCNSRTFIGDLSKNLKTDNIRIFKIISELNIDKDYEKIRLYRNKLTHSFSPFFPSARTEINKDGIHIEKREASIPTTEILEEVEKSIELLYDFRIKIEDEIKIYYKDKNSVF